MEPSDFPRRILLCGTGLSPQIITETLYALTVGKAPAFVPTEIHLITTVEGTRYALLALLDPEQGKFWQLCREYDLRAEAIRFDESTIHLIRKGDGDPLEDTRSETDSASLAHGAAGAAGQGIDRRRHA